MILTEKGSTRSTVSFLMIASMIFLGARFIVGFIEDTFPQPAETGIQWKTVNDVLKDSHEYDDGEDEPGATVSGNTKLGDTTSSDTKSGDTGTPSTESGGISRKKRTKLDLAKVFPDNVDQRPILIFFADDASILSTKMERRTLSIPDIRKKVHSDFYPVKIRLDKALSRTEYRLCKMYGSAASPIISIRDMPTGDSLAYNPGYLNGAKTLILLNNALAAKNKLDDGVSNL